MEFSEKKTKLLENLIAIEKEYSPEDGHEKADKLLLAYINDPEITAAFMKIDRWYA